MKELIGKVITGIAINKAADMLRFIDGNGESYIYYAEADCCSESWFQDFEGSIVDTKVTGFEQGETIVLDGEYVHSRQEYDQETPFVIHTDKLDFKFSLINSSNGYYSGWISFAGKKIPVYAKNEANTFKQLKTK
jgi:hypothetical protein